jgi:hypothetical protein
MLRSVKHLMRGNLTMDHDVVVREKMTEKYLLQELAPNLRDEFEEHFFDCPECARDVRAESEFVAHSKIILAEKTEPSPVHAKLDVPAQVRQGWFAWFRPAFALPLLVLLLVVVAYQSLVILPQLQVMNNPQVLPATTVNLSTYGSNAAPLVVHEGEGFLLNVVIPPDRRYSTYRVDLHRPDGRIENSVAIPASADDTWPIRFPAAKWQNGNYKLTVHGIANGQTLEVGSGSFELQVQK